MGLRAGARSAGRKDIENCDGVGKLSKLGTLWVSSEGMGVVCGSWVDAWGRDNWYPDRNSHKIRQARAPVKDPHPSKNGWSSAKHVGVLRGSWILYVYCGVMSTSSLKVWILMLTLTLVNKTSNARPTGFINALALVQGQP